MATFNGTSGHDVLHGGTGDDLLYGFAGNDTLYGGDGNDNLDGGDGNDVLYGQRGDDAIYAGRGDDLLIGGAGRDTLYGNEGNDTASYFNSPQAVFVNLATGRGSGGDATGDLLFSIENLIGSSFGDTLIGDSLNNRLSGLAGNDSIRGGDGNDTLDGGDGYDTLYGENGNDVIYGGAQDDLLYGQAGNDTLYGGIGFDNLDGGDGNDYLSGEDGNDALFGGAGQDILLGGNNNDTLYGNEDNDTLDGGDGYDYLDGGSGDDSLFGGAQDDLLYGRAGNDTLYGGIGFDNLDGGDGDDYLDGEDGNDALFGGLGNDTGLGGNGNDTLYGNEGDDYLDGGFGNDQLFGGIGSDTLYGNVGADTLTGNAGDTLSDIFVIGRVTGAPTQTTGGLTLADADVITDFQPCVDFISLGGGLSYDDLSIFAGTGTYAGSTIIQDTLTGEYLVILQGVDSTEIDGTAFIPAGPPTVRITANDPVAAEPSSTLPGDPGELTVSIHCPATSDLAINYTISGTATNGTDYTSLSGTVIIPAGSTSATIPIIPLADTLVEGDETVTLTLTPGTGYNVGSSPDNTATVTITDAPPSAVGKPTVIVSALDPTASETGDPGAFQFTRTGGDISQALTIRYTVTGTATPGTDYTPLTGTVTIAAGQSVSAPVSFTPLADAINEAPETVIVTIAEDLPYTVGAADSATVRIADNNPLTGTPAGAGPIVRYDVSGAFQASHTNFTTAVAAATANDIIVAQAGTYSEPGTVTIDKPLTLRGPNAGLSASSGSTVPPATVSTAPALPVFTIVPGVNNVTIEGLTVQMNGENAIRLQGASDNLTIRQNDFTGVGPANGGVIYLDAGGAGSGLNVIDNLIRDVITAPGNVTSAIQVFQFDTIRVTDNAIANLPGPGIVADAITNASSVINTNTINNVGQQGIQLAGGSATIENNDITNANTTNGIDRGGIRLRNSGLVALALGTVNVNSNVVVNSFNGVAISNGTNIVGTVLANYNNLIANSNAGLYHGGSGTVDATNNWWDSETGPVVGGTGSNAISGPSAASVVYAPFATMPF